MFASRGPLAQHRRKLLDRGEHFFARHGAKTVFVARWITGARVVAAVVAGASAMPWRTFLGARVSNTESHLWGQLAG